MQLATINKEQFGEFISDTDVQKRIRTKLEDTLRERGLWSEKYDDRCKAFETATGLPSVYAEQALHGKPVFRFFQPMCDKLGISAESLLAE